MEQTLPSLFLCIRQEVVPTLVKSSVPTKKLIDRIQLRVISSSFKLCAVFHVLSESMLILHESFFFCSVTWIDRTKYLFNYLITVM